MRLPLPLILVLALFGLSSAKAQTLFYEDFNYTAGGLPAVSGSGSTPWTAQTTGAGTNTPQVSAGSLTYGTMTNQTGGKLTLGTSGEDDYAGSGVFNITMSGAGETAYLSALINVTSAQATGDYFLHFTDSTAITSNFSGRVFAKSSGAGYVFGVSITANNGGIVNYETTPRTFNVPVFVVLKVTSVNGTLNDTAALFLDPALDSTEPAPTLSNTDTSTADRTKLDRISLRQGGATAAAGLQIDTIRIATNWANVTSSFVPVELSSFATE